MHFLTWTVLCVPILFSISCNRPSTYNQSVALSGNKVNDKDRYEHVYVALSASFLDRPDTKTLRRLLTKVLPLYGYPINEKNLKDFGTELSKMRNASKGEVSELDILEEMVKGKENSLIGRLD